MTDDDLFTRARDLISAVNWRLDGMSGTEHSCVKRTVWEQHLYQQMRTGHAALSDVAGHFEETVDYADDLLADVFAYLWLAAPELRRSTDVQLNRWANLVAARELHSSWHVQQLRSATVHDDVATAMAMVWLSEPIRQWLRNQPSAEDTRQHFQTALETLEAACEAFDGSRETTVTLEEAFNDLLELAMGDGDDSGDSKLDLATAAEEASDELSRLTGLGAILGLSTRGGSGANTGLSSAQTWEVLRRLDRSGIARFADLIGRFVTAAAAAVTHSPTPHGVELSERVWDADAAELATRGHRLLRLEHLERVGAAELITDNYNSEPQAAGPMVLVLDESYSMANDTTQGPTRLVWSKAFALAMWRQARRTNRTFTIISFAGSSEQRVWTQPGPVEITSFLEHFFGGGTSYEEALDMALNVVAEEPTLRGADIILVTDDDRVDVPDAWLQGWCARRDAITPTPPRLRGVGVDSRLGSWLQYVADTAIMVTDLTEEAQVGYAARMD